MTALDCYVEGDPLSKLKDIQKQYISQLSSVYNKLYSEEEWKKMVESTPTEVGVMGKNETIVIPFPEKPNFTDLYNYNNNGIFPFEEIKLKLDSIEPFNITDRTFKNNYNSLISYIKQSYNQGLDYLSGHKLMVEAFEYVQKGFLDDDIRVFNSKISEFQNSIRSAFSREVVKSEVLYASPFLFDGPDPEYDAIPGLGNDINLRVVGFNANLGRMREQITKISNSALGFCVENIEELVTNAVRKLFTDQIDKLIKKVETAKAENDLRKSKGKTAYKDSRFTGALDTLNKLKNKVLTTISEAESDQVIFQEQCFMLGNLSWFIEQRKLGTSLDLPYASGSASTGSAAPLNTAINIQGSPFAFVNKLAVSPDQKFLFDLKNEELSSITPSMRFFKVDSDPTDGKDLSTEITFDTNVANDLSKYMSRTSTKQGGRGLGVGVKSFDFSYEGTDPFSAKKAIKAKLVLYAPNFSDLLRERTGEKGRKYSYVDLALKTGKYRGKEADEAAKRAAEGKAFNIERENLDKLNFRLRAEVLWTANKDSLRLFSSQGKKDAIYNSAISFYLTPTIHEFDFDETGAVTFTINYLAYIEDYFAQPQFDIFGNLGADKKYRDLIFDYFRKAECDVEGFTDFKQIDAQYISSVNSNSLNKIVSKLRSEQLLYYVNISKDQMKDWLKNPIKSVLDGKQIDTNVSTPVDQSMVNAAVNKATASIKDASDEEKKKLNLGAYRLSLVANSDLRENIAFFYLSDLINVVMSLVEDGLEPKKKSNYYDAVVRGSFTGIGPVMKYVEERLENDKDPRLQATMEQFKKMRIVLGPMEVTPYTIEQQKQKMYSCTLGDLPISLNYFLDFMAERVLSNDFISYPFSKFIKDIINDCIKNFMNSDGCLMSDSSQRVSLNSTTVLAYNTSTGPMDDDLSNLIIEGNGGKWSTRGCLLLNKVPESKFPILKISGPNDQRTNLDISTMRNYYIFSIARRYPTDLYNGIADIDAKSGIFHYTLGADKGIVKNISLDKTNTPGLKELRFEQEGFDGLTQLREVYNANITTFLNPQTFPGTYIYVEPRGFDPTASEDLSKFGIGGYYMITKTAHSIQPGNAETTINAAWVADKGGTVVKNEGDDSETKTEDNNKILKCRVQAVQSDGRG